MTREERVFLSCISKNGSVDLTDVDLMAVFRLAAHHSLLPLVYERLSENDSFDASKYPKTGQRVLSAVFSQTKRTNCFSEIYKKFIANGVKPIVLKGIICRNLYGDLCDHRPSGDEDILIQKEDFFTVSRILNENGFVAKDEPCSEKALEGIQEITFFNKSAGLNIEVHLNAIGTENKVRRKMNKYFEDAFDDVIEIEIAGNSYYTFNYTKNYIYLFYHLFKHFALSGVGVRQMLDMFKFLETYSDKIDRDVVRDAIKAISADKFYADIIEIGNRYMGFELDTVFKVTEPDRLLADILSTGSFGNATSEQAGSKVMVMAALESGGKHSKLRAVFPTIESLREHYTVLYKHPYLLPYIWVKRILKYVFRVLTGKRSNLSDSEQIAKDKIKLLKDYHII